jgi:hypothetical protein
MRLSTCFLAALLCAGAAVAPAWSASTLEGKKVELLRKAVQMRPGAGREAAWAKKKTGHCAPKRQPAQYQRPPSRPLGGRWAAPLQSSEMYCLSVMDITLQILLRNLWRQPSNAGC